MTTNVKNLREIYNSETRSFNAAIRFCADMSKAQPVSIPAAPEKGDKSAEAAALRETIKKAKKINGVIVDCKAIVSALGIDANSLKAKNIGNVLSIVKACAPMQDNNGVAVQLGNLPAYLRAKYPNAYIVVAAPWLETIAAAAANCLDGKPIRAIDGSYVITESPEYDGTTLVNGASGSIVDAKGTTIADYDAIVKDWDYLAGVNKVANEAAKAAKDAKFAELAK